jgi:hypothetical protein
LVLTVGGELSKLFTRQGDYDQTEVAPKGNPALTKQEPRWRIRTVKHVKALSQGAPKSANQIQDIICQVAAFIASLSGAIGGVLPVVGFVEEKCDLPVPGGDNVS